MQLYVIVLALCVVATVSSFESASHKLFVDEGEDQPSYLIESKRSSEGYQNGQEDSKNRSGTDGLAFTSLALKRCVCIRGNRCCCPPRSRCCNSPGRCCCTF